VNNNNNKVAKMSELQRDTAKLAGDDGRINQKADRARHQRKCKRARAGNEKKTQRTAQPMMEDGEEEEEPVEQRRGQGGARWAKTREESEREVKLPPIPRSVHY